MLAWVHLGTAVVPGGGAELRLLRRGDEFVIMAGRTPLMNSRMSGSEESLARLSWERVRGRRAPHLLVGGLGPRLPDGVAALSVGFYPQAPALIANSQNQP